jgi:hypothetical protein
MTDQNSNLRELRATHQRRLQILQLQAAHYGLPFAPPHILMEIETIQQQIADIDLQFEGWAGPENEIGGDRISILFMSADPTNAARLRLGEEFREIQEKLQLAKLRANFNLETRMSVRPADISQALLDVKPRFVHFSGHGTARGELCAENLAGEIQFLSAEALAALFKQFANEVSCVLLNACYSEIQARAISRHIPYVIGMSQAIEDKAAIVFSVGFYQAIGAGRNIEDAFELGKALIMMQGSVAGHLTPVLIRKT